MKRPIYIFYILLTVVALSGCIKEQAAPNKLEPGTDVTFRVNIEAGENKVETRSLNFDGFDETSINDINAFVIDINGNIKSYRYINAFTINGPSGTVFDLLGQTGMYSFAIIANVGHAIGSDINTLAQLENKLTTLTDGASLGECTVMSVLTPFYSIDNANYNNDGSWIANIPGDVAIGNNEPIQLKRRSAKVTVTIDNSGLDPNVNMNIQSITLKNVPKSYSYFTAFKPSAASQLTDGDYINTIESNFAPTNHDEATPLYMLENIQGDKTIEESNKYKYFVYDPYPTQRSVEETRYTSPHSMVPDSGADLCTYVEIEVLYDDIRTENQNIVGEEGIVTYKIYLGTGLSGNRWNNFDVNGNTWYKVSVALTGKGGINEINWRIDTDIERYGPGLPEESGNNYSYTIYPADAMFWLADGTPELFADTPWVRHPLSTTGYQFSTNNSMLSVVEYYEGRYSTFMNFTNGNRANNFPAMSACRNQNYVSPPNNDNNVNVIRTYLPSQNELQMMNIFCREATFSDGTYWSSTQLNESAIGGNNQWARVVDYNNRGQAYSLNNTTTSMVRCLRTPEGDRNRTEDGSPTSEKVLTYNGQEWDGIVYPYLRTGANPVVINRETFHGIDRGLKNASLRTGMPYNQLTPNYHTIRKVYGKFRVAKADCHPDGSAVQSGSTSPMDWYTAMGYTSEKYGTAEDIAPNINRTEKTGCNAYYEDGDRTQIGKWRVPTSLELQEIWVMGGNARTNMPANPAVAYYTFTNNPTNQANRIQPIYLKYTGFRPLSGNTDALLYYINGNYSNGKTSTTILRDLYWSATTTFEANDTTPTGNGIYAYKQDFYSGDGYSGRVAGISAKPDKMQRGLVRCVMDVTN